MHMLVLSKSVTQESVTSSTIVVINTMNATIKGDIIVIRLCSIINLLLFFLGTIEECTIPSRPSPISVAKIPRKVPT